MVVAAAQWEEEAVAVGAGAGKSAQPFPLTVDTYPEKP